MAASIDAPAAGPRSTRSRGYRDVIAFTASYTAFWARAMVRIVLGPSVAISVVLSAQSASVSARAEIATSNRAAGAKRYLDLFMGHPPFAKPLILNLSTGFGEAARVGYSGMVHPMQKTNKVMAEVIN